MNSEKVISNIKKAIKEHLDNNYAYDMLVDFELDVIDWNSLFGYIKQLKDNWNKLKKYIKTEIPEDVFIDTEWFVSILDKMQELEQGDLIEK